VTPGGNAKRGERPRNPNQTAATAERTGVDLTSATARRFGAGRGSQGGPTAEEIALYNFQVESRRDAASRPQPQARGPGLQKISKPKQDQTTTIRTKDGRLVQDDNAGTNMNPTKRH
jgi:hypothetical protein